MELQARIMELFASRKRGDQKTRKTLALLLVAWIVQRNIHSLSEVVQVFCPEILDERHPSRTPKLRDLRGLITLGIQIADELKSRGAQNETEKMFLSLVGEKFDGIEYSDFAHLIKGKRGQEILATRKLSPEERTAFEEIVKGSCTTVVELMRMLFPGVRSSTEQGGKPYAEAKSIVKSVFKKVELIVGAGNSIPLDAETKKWRDALCARNLLPSTSQELTAILKRFLERKPPRTSNPKNSWVRHSAEEPKSSGDQEKAKPLMPSTASCSNTEGHHWVIEPPQGPTSTGKCRYCGVSGEFQNAPPKSPWEVTSSRFSPSRPSRELP